MPVISGKPEVYFRRGMSQISAREICAVAEGDRNAGSRHVAKLVQQRRVTEVGGQSSSDIHATHAEPNGTGRRADGVDGAKTVVQRESEAADIVRGGPMIAPASMIIGTEFEPSSTELTLIGLGSSTGVASRARRQKV
jgi:hypothetical protein